MSPREISVDRHWQVRLSIQQSEVGSRIGYKDAYFGQCLINPGDITLEVLREVWQEPRRCLASASCYANILDGKVKDYTIGIAEKNKLYRFHLNSQGEVVYVDDEMKDEQRGGEDQVFPPFRELLRRFVDDPLDADSPSTVLSPFNPQVQKARR